MSKTGLGRGLGALLAGSNTRTDTVPSSKTEASAPGESAVRILLLTQIQPSPLQPRKDFPPESLQELADSIREQGIVQPLIVRPGKDGFELIAGERRWRAAQLAGLTEAPVIVRDANDREVVELALIENLQRENLNPLEEALGYSHLVAQFQLTQEDIARRVGKSRAVVANSLRLLKLPDSVRELIRSGQLSVGHAKVLLGLTEAIRQQSLAARVVAESLNVRQVERLVAQLTGGSPIPGKVRLGTPAGSTRDLHVTDLENRLRERLGTPITLRYRAGKGALEIRFFSDDELSRILDLIGVPQE